MLTIDKTPYAKRRYMPRKTGADQQHRQNVAGWLRWHLARLETEAAKTGGTRPSDRELQRQWKCSGGTINRALSAERLGLDAFVRIVKAIKDISADRLLFEPPPRPNAAPHPPTGPKPGRS